MARAARLLPRLLILWVATLWFGQGLLLISGETKLGALRAKQHLAEIAMRIAGPVVAYEGARTGYGVRQQLVEMDSTLVRTIAALSGFHGAALYGEQGYLLASSGDMPPNLSPGDRQSGWHQPVPGAKASLTALDSRYDRAVLEIPGDGDLARRWLLLSIGPLERPTLRADVQAALLLGAGLVVGLAPGRGGSIGFRRRVRLTLILLAALIVAATAILVQALMLDQDDLTRITRAAAAPIADIPLADRSGMVQPLLSSLMLPILTAVALWWPLAPLAAAGSEGRQPCESVDGIVFSTLTVLILGSATVSGHAPTETGWGHLAWLMPCLELSVITAILLGAQLFWRIPARKYVASGLLIALAGLLLQHGTGAATLSVIAHLVCTAGAALALERLARLAAECRHPRMFSTIAINGGLSIGLVGALLSIGPIANEIRIWLASAQAVIALLALHRADFSTKWMLAHLAGAEEARLDSFRQRA